MKIFLTLFLLATLFFGCSEKKVPDKDQEKALFDEVIKIHDKVMGLDEELMKNKMLLDSAVKHDIPAAKDSAKFYSNNLTLADSAMSTWMHKFDAENTGKTHEQIMNYLTDQKKQIMNVDLQIATAIEGADKYLTKIKMK
jgi:hypothetical protein